MKFPRFFVFPFILTLLFLSLFLKGCLPGDNQDTTLKIGFNTWPGFDIALYAQEKGLFEKRGLEVELIRFDNGQDVVRAMMRSSLDMAFVSLWELLQADPGEDQPTFVMVTNISKGSDGLVTTKNIDSIEKLKDKKVAAKLGTVSHLILLEALKLHNLKPQEVSIENVSNEMGVEMIKDGNVDGVVVWEPLMSQTAKEIQGNVVYTTREVDSLVIDGLATRASFVETHQKEIKKFILSWFNLMGEVEAQPKAVYQVVGEKLQQTPEDFAKDYAGLEKGDIELNERMFAKDGRLSEAIQEIIQLLKEDPRHGRIIRQDLEIDAKPIKAAIKEWKP